MTEPTSTPPFAAPSLAAPGQAKARAAWPWLLMAALVLGSLWVAWGAQSRVADLEAELVKRQQDTQNQAQEALVLARQAQEAARDAAARAAVLDTRLTEVALQRTQVEDLIKSMSRSRDENLLLDIEAALRVAMQQASLTGSAEPLVSTLQTADERIAHTQQPRLEPVRRALAKDLDRIKSTRIADLPTLAIKLDEAIRLVDELPLLNQADASSRQQTSASSQSSKNSPSPSNPTNQSQVSAWADRILGWGGVVSQSIWREAQGLVRVTQIQHPEAMLMTPSQSYFLRENLKLRLLNARLNLLSRQTAAANADLTLARQTIGRYFDSEARKTQLIVAQLSDITAQSPLTQVPRPDDTLAALSTLSALAGGR